MTSSERKPPDAREQGVRAFNQEFRRFEQVRKEQTYRLSEHEQDEEFDEAFQIPVCDMTPFFADGAEGRQRFANELGAALEQIGFAILVGHRIDPALHASSQALIREFFDTIPPQERTPYLAARHGSVNQGYFPVRETTVIHPDLVEGWVFCRRAFDLDGDEHWSERDFWPRAGFEPRFRQVVQAHEGLILPVMQSVLRHLGCDPHLYDERLGRPSFGLRLNYYLPLANAVGGAGGRMLGHEDVDLFTLLPAPAVEGLQVLNRANGKWIRLAAPPGSIILNTGDYLQRISNDRLPSTTHRVSRPRDTHTAGAPRVSLPMAVYVREEDMLEVLPGLGAPKYDPIRALTFHTRITSKYYGEDYAVD